MSYDSARSPYCGRSEDQQNPEYAQDPAHGTGGPLPVSDLQFTTPLAEAWLQAASQVGLPVRDINTGNLTGVTTMQVPSSWRR